MAERTMPEGTIESDYIRFGDVAIERCREQCQYAVRYLAGVHRYADLASDLRWYGDTADYHKVMIHKDDADEFVRRMRDYRIKNGIGWSGEK